MEPSFGKATPSGGGDSSPSTLRQDASPYNGRLSQVSVVPTNSVGKASTDAVLGPYSVTGRTGAGDQVLTGVESWRGDRRQAINDSKGDGQVNGAGGGLTNVETRKTSKNEERTAVKMWSSSSNIGKKRENSVHRRKVLSRGCFRCGDENHVIKDCPERRSEIHCICCNSKGHYARECNSNQAKGKEGACLRCGKFGHRRKECVTEEQHFEEIIETPVYGNTRKEAK